MLERTGFSRLLLLAFLFAGMLLSGCQEETTKTEAIMEPVADNIAFEKDESEAVRLYVDAIMLNDIQKWDQAIRTLNDAIKYAPDFSLAHSFKGDIYQVSQRYEQSADAYEQAAQIDPWSFKDFFNLGKVSQIIEQFKRAANAYENACQLEPDHYDAHFGAAKCYYELQDFDAAFDYSQRAKEIAPDLSDPDVLLGDIYEERGDHTAAIDSYRRALEIEGNSPRTMVSLAVAYTKTRRFAAAEELLVSAIALDPSENIAFQYLGFVQLQLHKDDLGLAIDSYTKAIELNEKDHVAYKGLGVVYMLKSLNEEKQGNTEAGEAYKAEALANWDISLQINPDQPELRNLMSRYNKH